MLFELFRSQILVLFINRYFDLWNRVLHTFIVYGKRDAEESASRQVFKCRQRCLGSRNADRPDGDGIVCKPGIPI